ncbi:hypothetical protein BOX15_Mlig016174g3 [Macrostomum lignano]|uniref:FCP1 homology domain-containing protein n=1 Tax=Macrostomum lignano TaxID=282301 RepID=A0A267ESD1_9PLAT|nr:hypothetical protein BOX15_Mlig016174g3 [Macrostomum lignano]
MDISSVITQVTDPATIAVNKPPGPENAEEGGASASNEESSFVQSPEKEAEVSSPLSLNKTDENPPKADLELVKSPVDGKRRRQRGSGGGGSGLLNRLLCCFGVGASNGPGGRAEHYRNGQTRPQDLLGPRDPAMADRICAVIDLDETLVHSSFKYVQDPDFAIGVEIEGFVHQVYVLKRPYADEFLRRMGELFECVLFTASLAKYADPVSDHLDKWGALKYRLFREACVFHCDNYVKDLSLLGRPVDRCVIIDNSPASYMLNKENAIQVKTWLGDRSDTELRDLLPYMEELAKAQSVSTYLREHPPPSHSLLNFGHILHLHDH